MSTKSTVALQSRLKNCLEQFSVIFRPRAFRGLQARRRNLLSSRLQSLERRELLAGTPIISEILASNGGGLRDQDGDSSDWIEIYNPTADAIDLTGWALTDSTSDLSQWQFPSVTIGANQFMTIFASGKNRTTGSELHTNFRLSASGEYLALVAPGGSIASEYSPAFPPQVENVSYGVAFDTTRLIEPGASAQVLIPPNDSLGSSWQSPSFNASAWTNGTTGIGFGVVQPGFNVTYIRSNVDLENLNVARNVVANPALQFDAVHDHASVINYMGNGGGGRYAADLAFPTQSIGDDADQFIVQGEASVRIPSSGDWTFGVNSDDGFELQLERNGVLFTSEFFDPRGADDSLATFNIPEGGDWEIRLLMYERGGGASVELFAASGAYTSFDETAFDLVGDTATGGLAVYSTLGPDSNLVVGTNVGTAMLGINSSAYIRVPFNAPDPAAYEALLLNIRYNDGFVAYLNGIEVARRNALGSVAFNSSAVSQRTLLETVTPESINLTPFLYLLNAGQNVLAIQGLNSSASDDSFLILPELTGVSISSQEPRYFQVSTPGGPNSTPFDGFADRVSANMAAGFYDSPFTVTLSTPASNAEIRYTTDGSAPSEMNGLIYTGPISITGTTTLRSQAFQTGFISLPSITRSYLFLDDVIRQSPSDDVAGGDPDFGEAPANWPSSWGNNVVDYGIDQTIIQQEGATRVKDALKSIPSLSITTDLANLFDPSTGIYANAFNDGRDWERPASLELLNPNGSTGFQVNAGLRVRGGFSRSGDNPKHAFRLFFRGEYGDSTLDYPLSGSGGTGSFKKIDLRTAQNYSWSFGGDPNNTMIQDVFSRESQGAMGQPYTRSNWYHLYLDGQYWGVYQTQERAEAEYAASYFGGSASDYDVLKPEAGSYTVYATDGNSVAYNRLHQLATTLDLSDNANYFRLQGKNADGVNDPSIPDEDVLVDVDNLIVYMMGILHGGNLDAPISAFLGNQAVNNFFAVRNRLGRQGFRYFQHDGEHTLLNVGEDRNGPFPAGAESQHFNPQFLHQQLMANAEYRRAFADAVQKNFFNNGPMTADNAKARFQKHVDTLDQAIIAESARWGDSKRPDSPLGRADWLAAVDNMQNGFLGNRNPVLLQQFRNNGLFPTIDSPQSLINGLPKFSGEIISGDILKYSASGGIVYYTTDGSDPRLVGGGINPAAVAYDATFVTTTLVTSGSNWKYFDQGTDLGEAWRAGSFDDSTWVTGDAELGYGDGDETTTVGFGSDPGAKFITTYFRRNFNVTSASQLVGLKLRLKRDDGAVVYVNGVEVTRSNMPAGVISASTPAIHGVGGSDEQTFYEFDVNPALLVNGQNTIAVELHQVDASSSDVSFDAELIASSSSNPGVTLSGPVALKARVLDGSTWSALSESVFTAAVPAAAGNLAITEVHYNPAAEAGTPAAPFNDKQNFEFIELRNIGAQTITLAGVRFTAGITFDFSTGTVPFLEPGQSVVVIKNRAAFELRYGTNVRVAGVYTGNLDNGGEQIRLTSASNVTIQDFNYDDEPTTTPPWPVTPDGGGYSLTVKDVAASYSSPANWRASYLLNGTPGYEENDYPNAATISNASIRENIPDGLVGRISGSDPNAGDVVRLSLLTALDSSQFRLVGNELRVGSAGLDFEAGSSRQVIIRSTDEAGLFSDVTLIITVINVNESPVFGGGNTYAVAENTISVTTVAASDPELATVTYSIAGGADGDLFEVDAASGALSFIAAPNFEHPMDADGNNVYLVRVGVSDGVNPVATRVLSVSVTDTIEVTFSFAGGVLTVTGSEADDDRITVSNVAGLVRIIEQSGIINTGTAVASVNQVIITGRGGNDLLQLDRTLGAGIGGQLFGDEGNDILLSGSGNDVIDGGNGNDTVSYRAAQIGVTVNLGTQELKTPLVLEATRFLWWKT